MKRINNKKNFILGIILIIGNVIGIAANLARNQNYFENKSLGFLIGSCLIGFIGLVLVAKSIDDKKPKNKGIEKNDKKQEIQQIVVNNNESKKVNKKEHNNSSKKIIILSISILLSMCILGGSLIFINILNNDNKIKMQEMEEEKEYERQKNLNNCFSNARHNRQNLWEANCPANNKNCSLRADTINWIESRYESDIKNCHVLYGW